jgi:hypothetical protein
MKRYTALLILTLSVTLLAQDRRELPLPSSGNVTLPLDEYNKLVELASKPVVKPEAPPVSYAIKRADMKLRVANDSVFGTIQCDGEIFAKGVARIPLLNAPAVLDARQAGKALPLEQHDGMQTAILSGPADFSIMLDAGMPLVIEAGRASFTLSVPAAGSAQLSLEIPGEHTNVKISPGLITNRASDNGRTIIEATLTPGQTANVWWTTREVAAPVAPREARYLSSIKTLASVSEADLKLVVLCDVTVVQGEPSQFVVEIPDGFEMTGVTGATLESEELKSGHLILKTNVPLSRSHQFLISLEKPISAAKADIPLLVLKGAQRETGEVLVEGEGTLELTATEGGTLKRMDVKETNYYLRSLARNPMHAAFRYHRQAGEPPSLALAWTRFPDSSVLAAAAERAEATTLITSEGRSLTEIKLTVKNQAQPFLKVGLPPGASILTADVAGEKVKPVQGPDGSRVPLLRTGFRPSGPYSVTYVFMHAGAPFAKKGDSELSLPKMDVPIGFLQWEVFLPERYKVKDFGGDAISANLLPPNSQRVASVNEGSVVSMADGSDSGMRLNPPGYLQGQMGGIITDATGAVLPGATVQVTNQETRHAVTSNTNAAGRWVVANIPSGNYKIMADLSGFQTQTYTDVRYNANVPIQLNFMLQIRKLEQQVEVSMNAENLLLESSPQREIKKNLPLVNEVSSNVVNLQRRAAGDLPIRVDVPHEGGSYRFVRPLVLDEETKVTFHYKSK